MSFTWPKYDDESEGEVDDKVLVFIGKYDSCSESSEEEMLVEELVETYREILIEWKESWLREEKQKKPISFILHEKGEAWLNHYRSRR